MTIHVERGVSREFVDENCREEPVCSKYNEGLLVVINKSSFVCVGWTARQ